MTNSDESPATADICDAMPNAQVIDLAFKNYGGKTDFSGPALCLKTNNDNSGVKELLCSPGEGRVLCVDNEGQTNRAMVGGNLAKWGFENGWAAIVVNGMIRDQHELTREDIAVKALGAWPRKSDKGSAPTHVQAVVIGGVAIVEGMWVTGDLDGVVVTAGKPVL